MEPRALRRLLSTLRDAGVTHYKTADVDIALDPLFRKQAPEQVGVVAVGPDGERIPVTRDTASDPLSLLFAHERMGA